MIRAGSRTLLAARDLFLERIDELLVQGSLQKVFEFVRFEDLEMFLGFCLLEWPLGHFVPRHCLLSD